MTEWVHKITKICMKKQMSLDLNTRKIPTSFGGTLLGQSYKSHAKTQRPLCTKRMIHLVMRSKYATGKYSMLRKAKQVRSIIDTQAAKFGVRIYDFANVGNHLHLSLKISDKTHFKNFLRSISGLIMRLITGARRGSKKLNHIATHFWDQRPFTRIVELGKKSFKVIARYLFKNKLESQGFHKDLAIETAKRAFLARAKG